MKISLTRGGRLTLFAMLTGCLVQVAQAAPPRTEIAAANASFSAAAAAGNSKALAALYAIDAQIMPAGSEIVAGRNAIERFWQGALETGIAQVSLKTVELYVSSDHCTEVGRYELHSKVGEVLDRGKYIVIWHRERAHWKLLRDMFSSDGPAQPR